MNSPQASQLFSQLSCSSRQFLAQCLAQSSTTQIFPFVWISSKVTLEEQSCTVTILFPVCTEDLSQTSRNSSDSCFELTFAASSWFFSRFCWFSSTFLIKSSSEVGYEAASGDFSRTASGNDSPEGFNTAFSWKYEIYIISRITVEMKFYIF